MTGSGSHDDPRRPETGRKRQGSARPPEIPATVAPSKPSTQGEHPERRQAQPMTFSTMSFWEKIGGLGMLAGAGVVVAAVLFVFVGIPIIGAIERSREDHSTQTEQPGRCDSFYAAVDSSCAAASDSSEYCFKARAALEDCIATEPSANEWGQ